ncbi:mRNA decapping protein 2 Box A domain [Trinorchestia longiramus]|nr:mRNA decapping protein 2 Box A domain [Trinorchestia longiramus]
MVNRHDDSFKIPIEALKDCFGRFFLMKDNRPYEDRIHFCAYLEQAYWFYIDSWVDNDKKLKNVSFLCFIQQIVDKIGVTVPGGGSVQTIVSEFTSFKHRVGTYGAILVNTALTKVLLVQTRCLETFGVPLYDQDEFRLEFLKRYYPKVYKMRVDHEREARLEKQKDKALRDPNHPSEKTVKQQLAEDKLRNQKAKLTSVMTMLKNATSRSEALKKQALLQKNTTASDSPADLESRKFRFKTHLKARPDDGTSGSVTCGDAATPLHGSTIHQHACAAPLHGSTAPLLNSTAPLLNSIAPLPGSTAPLKHNPCNTGSTTANSMFPKFQIERSKTWDTAQLDYSDIMRAVEFTWRATYPNTTNTVSAVADRKRLGKENLHH